MHRLNHWKQWTAVLLLFVFLFTLPACKDDTTETDTGTEATGPRYEADVALPYSREDGVNPYTATSLMNWTIMPLLYDGLFSVNNAYEPQAVIAASYSTEGTQLTVTLNDNYRFSDGTTVSAADVIYSFEKAKDSSYYRSALSSFSSAAISGGRVVFTMVRANQYAAAALTFPIVKSGTAAQDDSIPVGSGPYVYAASENGGVLTPNSNSSVSASVDQVYLSNTSDTDSLLYSLSIGNVDAVFDPISDGTLTRVTANTTQVPLNQLVFIGINTSRTGLGTATVRQCINAVLDKDALLGTGMDGYGTVAESPLNPSWYALEGVEYATVDADAAEEVLAQTFATNSITILTDADNAFKVKTANELARQLANAGISSTVNALEHEAYLNAIEGNSYDLYIGEMKLTNDMNLDSVLTSSDLSTAFYQAQAGTGSLQEFVTLFLSEMPFIPICFRNGVLVTSRNQMTKVETMPGNPLYNLTSWSIESD